MTTLVFFVPGAPVPYSRSAAASWGRFIPERNKLWRHAVRVEFRDCWAQVPGLPAEGEHRHGVVLLLDFHGANLNADLDNLAKEVLDALNGVAWHDDRQLVDLRVRRLPKHETWGAGVCCEVRWLPESDPVWSTLRPAKARKRKKAA